MAIAKKLTASAIASSLLLAIAGPAFAADQTTVNAVAQKMFDLGIVKGNATNNGSVDLNLTGTLTRAELVTTLVRSFGQEQAAQFAAGAPSFGDVHANDWYSGWVAVAKNIAAQKGVAIGRDASTFDPNGQLSKVEALVFIMKFMGINVPTTQGANWYESWVNEAVKEGILTAAQGQDVLTTANTKATRGEAFTILDGGYSFKDANGKSLYTTYADSELPTLNLTVPQTTADAKVVLSGSAADNKGVASVTVNGEAVAITNGAFSKEIALKVGKNPIAVVVTDLAGNAITKSYEVVRGNVAADAIQADDITVAAGQTATVAAKLIDKNKEAIDGAIITGDSAVGSFANGVFTAGKTAGTGTLTLKSGDITKTVNVKVVAGALAKVSLPASVAVNATPTLVGTDSFGNKVDGVTWSVKTNGAFINNAGIFTATAAGNYTVVATQNGTSVEGTVGVYATTVASLKVETANQVIANNITTVDVTIKALDANGNFIPTAIGTPVVTGAGLTIGTVSAFTNGVATVKISASDAVAGQDLTINADLLGKTGSAIVKAVAQVATSVAITSTDDYLDTTAPGATKNLLVNVLDQAGVRMIAGEYKINLAITGPATFASAATSKSVTWNTYVGDTQTIYATETAASGAITVSAIADGLKSGTKVITAAVPQAVAAIKVTAPTSSVITAGDAANTALVYKVGTTDKYGVPRTFGGSFKLVIGGIDMTKATDLAKFVVTTSTDGGQTFPTTLASAVDFNSIPASVNAIKVYGKAVGSYSVQIVDAAATPALTASAVSTFSVQTGALANVIAPSTITYEALRGDKVTVQYQAVDAEGNPVKAAGITVTTGNVPVGLKVNSSTTPISATTDANGVASFDLTAVKLGALPLTIASVTNNGSAVGALPAAVTLNAVDSVVGSFTVTASNATTATKVYATAGESAALTVAVKDNNGYDMTTMATPADFLAAFSLTVNGTAVDLATPGITVTGSNGAFTVSGIQLTKAGTATLALTTKKLATAKTQSTLMVVKAGALDRAVIVSGADADTANVSIGNWNYNSTVTANVAKMYTIQLADMYGNVVDAVSNSADKVFTLSYSLSGTNYVNFADQDGVGLVGGQVTIAAGRNTATFSATTSAKAGVITATASGVNHTATITLK